MSTDSGEMDERAKEMLLKVGIPAEKHDQNMYQLSGGQRQRVAVARALVLLPEFVVLDECISSLDIRTQDNILGLLMDLKEEFGLSYLFISHDRQVVSRISDRLFRLEEGKLIAEE
jgi:ABC-type oligopeptide transport system ATPase subunit